MLRFVRQLLMCLSTGIFDEMLDNDDVALVSAVDNRQTSFPQPEPGKLSLYAAFQYRHACG